MTEVRPAPSSRSGAAVLKEGGLHDTRLPVVDVRVEQDIAPLGHQLPGPGRNGCSEELRKGREALEPPGRAVEGEDGMSRLRRSAADEPMLDLTHRSSRRRVPPLGRALDGRPRCVPADDGHAAVGRGHRERRNRSGARAAGLDVRHAGCWAHLLRKFRDVGRRHRPRWVCFSRTSASSTASKRAPKELGAGADALFELRRKEAAVHACNLLRQYQPSADAAFIFSVVPTGF